MKFQNTVLFTIAFSLFALNASAEDIPVSPGKVIKISAGSRRLMSLSNIFIKTSLLLRKNNLIEKNQVTALDICDDTDDIQKNFMMNIALAAMNTDKNVDFVLGYKNEAKDYCLSSIAVKANE